MKKMKAEIIITFIVMVVVGIIFNGVISVVAQNDFLNWQVLVCGVLIAGWYFTWFLASIVKNVYLKVITWITYAILCYCYAVYTDYIGVRNNIRVSIIWIFGLLVYTVICKRIFCKQEKTFDYVINSGNDGEFTHDQDNDGE